MCISVTHNLSLSCGSQLEPYVYYFTQRFKWSKQIFLQRKNFFFTPLIALCGAHCNASAICNTAGILGNISVDVYFFKERHSSAHHIHAYCYFQVHAFFCSPLTVQEVEGITRCLFILQRTLASCICWWVCFLLLRLYVYLLLFHQSVEMKAR